jgi:hypothetical protein
MEKFKLSLQDKYGNVYHDQVQGERIMINDLEAFVFQDNDYDLEGELIEGWNVSHLETGMRMASDLNKKWAIKKAKFNYEKYPECIEKGRQICIDKGIVLPVNRALAKTEC